MRTAILALGAALTITGVAAQVQKSATPAAIEANKHYGQGWSAVRAQSWDVAKAEFERAIENDPQFALAYYSLGRAEMGRRDFNAAIAAYLKCRDVYTSTTGTQFASQLDLRQRLNDRILEYRTAITQAQASSSSTKSNSQSQSLYVRELQNEISRLEEARDRTVNLSMDVAVPYFVPMALGAAYFRSGRFADAEREYKTALAANNNSGETHNNLAVLYLMTGRYDEADAEVKAAEKVGFHVAEELKGDIRAKKKAADR